MRNKLLYLYESLMKDFNSLLQFSLSTQEIVNPVFDKYISIHKQHYNYLTNIKSLNNLLKGNEHIDPIEEKYEFLKHIIDGFTVTDSEGILIESLNRCCLLTSQGEVLMDYYDMKGVVESVGRDVTIHATIDELLDFFKENEIS